MPVSDHAVNKDLEAMVTRVLSGTSASSVVETLSTCMKGGRTPKCIRTDNGTEFKSELYQTWANRLGIKPEYSRPYHCTDNAYIEQFNGMLRKEVINFYEFRNLAEVQRMLDDWRKRYNLSRPNFALGGLSY